jgi:hypothetical protein
MIFLGLEKGLGAYSVAGFSANAILLTMIRFRCDYKSMLR